MHTLADCTHDRCSHFGLLKESGLRELVVRNCQLRLVFLELVRFKEERQSFTDGTLANHLVQPVLLEVILDVKDRNLIRERLLHLQYLCPEHWLLVLLSAITVVIDAVVIWALGFIFVSTSTFPEKLAQFSLKVLHDLDLR